MMPSPLIIAGFVAALRAACVGVTASPRRIGGGDNEWGYELLTHPARWCEPEKSHDIPHKLIPIIIIRVRKIPRKPPMLGLTPYQTPTHD